jgi:hypothetical protein
MLGRRALACAAREEGRKIICIRHHVIPGVKAVRKKSRAWVLNWRRPVGANTLAVPAGIAMNAVCHLRRRSGTLSPSLSVSEKNSDNGDQNDVPSAPDVDNRAIPVARSSRPSRP